MATLPQRSQALDAMRGITLALMIVVNMSISETLSYAPLLHASWHGLTLTDLVFPSFLFVVGSAMSFSLPRYQGLGHAAVLGKIARRTAILFLCGFLLYWFPFFRFAPEGGLQLLPLGEARILGVLQRIALAWGLASLLLHFCRTRSVLLACGAILLGNWWVQAACGDYTLQGNAALKLDLWLLGPAHMYKGEGIPFDPEGLLGTLPAMVNVVAGYYAGRWVQARGAGYETVAKLMMAGAVSLVLALAWSGVFPLNKKLWTSSYVLCGIGVDLMALALLVYLIDMLGVRRWVYFFEVFGRNTLFLYLFAEVLMSVLWLAHIGARPAFEWIFAQGFQPWAGDKPGSLAFALVFMLGCWLLGYAMDRRRIYVKV